MAAHAAVNGSLIVLSSIPGAVEAIGLDPETGTATAAWVAPAGLLLAAAGLLGVRPQPRSGSS
jgi:hypothetical protein